MDFYVFRVGEKIHEDFYPALVQSGARLIQDKEGGLYLLLVFDSPSAEELEAVKRGKIRSYVLTDSSESFWFGMFKLQAGLSFDCTYNVLKNSPLEWEKRSNFFRQFNLLHILQVDPRTQILNAQRLVTMPRLFLESLYSTSQAAINSKDTEYSRHYDEWLSSLYKFPTEELMTRGINTGLLGQME